MEILGGVFGSRLYNSVDIWVNFRGLLGVRLLDLLERSSLLDTQYGIVILPQSGKMKQWPSREEADDSGY